MSRRPRAGTRAHTIGRSPIDATEVAQPGAHPRSQAGGPGDGERGDGAPRSGGRSTGTRWGRRPTYAVLGLLGLLAAVLLLHADRLHLSSDSVAQQSIVRTWLRHGHADTYLPPDTWLLKMPVYLVVESLPLAPSARVVVEAFVLQGLGLVLVAWATWVLAGQVGLRRPGDVVLPLAWLVTLGGGMGSYLVTMPNYRNVEVGLSFAGLALVARAVDAAVTGRGPWRPGARATARGAAAAAVAALLWLDDPYFAYLVALPLVPACVLWFALRRRDPRLLQVAALVVASLVALPVLRAGLAALGVHVVPDATGPTLSPREIAAHVPVLGPSLVRQLGWDEPGAVATTAHVLGALVLVAGVAAGALLAVLGWRSRHLVLTFLGVHWIVVVLGVLANRTIYDFHAGRYLLLAFYDVAVCLGLGAAALRRERPRVAAAITGLLVAAVVANGASAVAGLPAPDPERAEQRATLALLEGTGATKGYGQFWAADLYTHQSAGRLQVSDVECAGGRLRLRLWLTDTARTLAPVALGEPVVLLWEPAAGAFGGCTLVGLRAQLGEPAAVLPAPGGQQVVVYDHDLLPRLDPAPPVGR